MIAKILVVDDEPPIIQVLSYNLKQANYEVVIARDGEEALAQARQHQPDLILLDLMLPKIDGLEVYRILRSESDVPIIMLTARDDEIDRVVGLEMGADDYVVKPFSVRELMARIKTVLRRAKPVKRAENEDIFVSGALKIDISRHEICFGTKILELTTLEFDLLVTLARNAGHVLTREQLLELVWGYDYAGDGRVVDAVIKRLRQKLREADAELELITTIRGIGYRLNHVL